MKKNEMERILKIELQGTNRVPAMFFSILLNHLNLYG